MYKNKICGIYCIRNIKNNKRYIGQSVNIRARWSQHKAHLNRNIHTNDYLQRSWNKHGMKEFVFEILEQCPKEQLNDKERYYIDKYDTMNTAFGYNLKSGGQDTNTVTDYVKEKTVKGLKTYYREHPEAKQKNSERAYKQWSNPEIKAKILGKNNGMYGKTHTEEARKKISEVQQGRISPFRNKTPVFCIELNKVFKDAVTACKELGLHPRSTGGIFGVCRGTRKTCGGYHWKFLLENNIG